jgi:hypothetical protein
MHNNTYTVVGISTLNNTVKVRFANDMQQRIATLKRNKHTNIKLITCAPMQRVQCVQHAMQHETFAEDTVAQAVFAQFVAKYSND